MLAAERIEAPEGPKYAGLERLAGQRILSVERRGKFLLLPLEAPDGQRRDELVVHLGMTGVIRHTPPPAHLRVRVRLEGAEPATLYFQDVRRFGRFVVVPAGDYAALPTLAALGPDALDAAFTPEAFAAALATSRVAVKTLLLSQRPVAGVGNIYADEALWRAGTHPLRAAATLTRAEVRALHAAVVAVLEESVALQGTTLYDYRTVNGEVGAFLERLAVYGHEGDPCPRCGSTIEKLLVGQRGTHVCRRCQPPPRVVAGAGATRRRVARRAARRAGP